MSVILEFIIHTKRGSTKNDTYKPSCKTDRSHPKTICFFILAIIEWLPLVPISLWSWGNCFRQLVQDAALTPGAMCKRHTGKSSLFRMIFTFIFLLLPPVPGYSSGLVLVLKVSELWRSLHDISSPPGLKAPRKQVLCTCGPPLGYAVSLYLFMTIFAKG